MLAIVSIDSSALCHSAVTSPSINPLSNNKNLPSQHIAGKWQEEETVTDHMRSLCVHHTQHLPVPYHKYPDPTLLGLD
jgi:hypothetical protein